MRAVIITKPGDPEVLAVQEIDEPRPPGGDQVLVRVRAAGINRADLMQRRGNYPPPPGVPRDIPGLEFAGEVSAVGPAVVRWKPGQRVIGLVSGGAQADHVLAPEGCVAAMPESLDWVQAAALPEVFVTAHDALFSQLGLQMGETVLIHAAASGVGTAAVQLAHAAGCLTFGTSRTVDKLGRARVLGLDEPIVVAQGDADVFAKHILEATGGLGVNAILDLVGAPYLAANLKALAPRGRMICVGTTAGSEANIDLGVVLRKRLRIFGTMLRGRTVGEKSAAMRAFEDHVLPLVRCGMLKPVVDRTFKVEDVVEAHRLMERNETFGKIVLTF